MPGGWEKHIQTLFASVTLGLLVWIFSSVQELSITVARQTEQISGLREQVAGGVADRYTATEAKRDREISERRFQDIESRVRRLEQK